MAWRIEKEPRKKDRYRIWSTIANGYIAKNLTEDEVVREYSGEAAANAQRRARAEIELLKGDS